MLRLLAADPTWSRVVTLGRRPMPLAGDTHEHHVVDFDRLADEPGALECDDLAICLGTTIKAAGSQAAFRRVDLEIPQEAAEIARQRGATRLAMVSAYGADPTSRIFYNRVKGEAEVSVQTLGYESVTLLRPSLLDGERGENRPAERIGLAVLRPLAPLLVGPLRPLRPTAATDVARDLVAALRSGDAGVHVLGPEAIRDVA